MAEHRKEGREPLWMLIERQIREYSDEDFGEPKTFETSQKIAEKLDETEYNVSKNAGNWIRLTAAVRARNRVGRPFMQDLDQAVSALTLDDIQDIRSASMEIIHALGRDWPAVLASENRADVYEIVENKKTDLMVAKAKELGGEQGIRSLISESFEPQAIMESLGISEQEYKDVKAKVDAELAERTRVQELFAAVEGESEENKIKHLLNNNAEDDLIREMGGIEQPAIDVVRNSMEEELAEKKRREEELAAQKAAEAAGPALEDIPPDDMLAYIEGIREILEFSDVEKDIRIMCEQSSVPKVLVDIAVSEPERLDELEKEAGG